MAEVELIHHELVNDLLLLQWSDGSEHALPLASLRDNCPCAACAGEKDVFGNVYAGEKSSLSGNSFIIRSFEKVGLYGIRFFWKDGHSDGIFTNHLLELLEKNEK